MGLWRVARGDLLMWPWQSEVSSFSGFFLQTFKQLVLAGPTIDLRVFRRWLVPPWTMVRQEAGIEGREVESILEMSEKAISHAFFVTEAEYPKLQAACPG